MSSNGDRAARFTSCGRPTGGPRPEASLDANRRVRKSLTIFEEVPKRKVTAIPPSRASKLNEGSVRPDGREHPRTSSRPRRPKTSYRAVVRMPEGRTARLEARTLDGSSEGWLTSLTCVRPIARGAAGRQHRQVTWRDAGRAISRERRQACGLDLAPGWVGYAPGMEHVRPETKAAMERDGHERESTIG
jgi:hypothetical protein